jgi:hypothetical protein
MIELAENLRLVSTGETSVEDDAGADGPIGLALGPVPYGTVCFGDPELSGEPLDTDTDGSVK